MKKLKIKGVQMVDKYPNEPEFCKCLEINKIGGRNVR